MEEWNGKVPVTGPAPRSRLWNLFSPLYEDFQTAMRRAQRIADARAAAAELPYALAMRRLEEIDSRPHDSAVIGAYRDQCQRQGFDRVARAYGLSTRAIAARNATRVMIALNRFRAACGSYPTELGELVPGFLDELPLGPFCGEPFGYFRESPDAYRMWSFGLDGEDDGGVAEMLDGQERENSDELDDIYTAPRRDSFEEKLIAIPSTTSPTGGGG